MQVILGQKGERQLDGSFLLSDGSSLKADVVYYTVGGTPITEFLTSLAITDDKGFIKVLFG